MDDKLYFWNDETQCLSLAGCKGVENEPKKDLIAGDPIPEWYKKEQPEKFKHFKDSQQISGKKKVEFEEKKHNELNTLKNAFGKLKIRNDELEKFQVELQTKVDRYEASLEEIEELESIKQSLAESKELIKELSKYKLDAQKKISEFSSFISQLEPVLKQDSISKDDKLALLGIVDGLEKVGGGE